MLSTPLSNLRSHSAHLFDLCKGTRSDVLQKCIVKHLLRLDYQHAIALDISDVTE